MAQMHPILSAHIAIQQAVLEVYPIHLETRVTYLVTVLLPSCSLEQMEQKDC